jgi:HEAT repeat protein
MSDPFNIVEYALSSECGTAPITRNFIRTSTRAALVAVALDANESTVRRGRAVYLLGIWRDDETVSVIGRVVDDLDEAGRMAAASALGRVGTPAAMAALERLVADSSPDVRRVAINGLGATPTPEGVATLRRIAVSDPSELNRARAAELLE